MNIKIVTTLTLFLVTYLSPFFCHASLILNETRVVYPESKTQESVKVDNPTRINFLAQAWIENDQGQEEGRFTVYPPLSKISGNNASTLRIEKIDASNLPSDRETMMWLNVKEIPQKAKESGPQLVVAFKTRIKIFYRPKGIDPELHDSFTQMTWRAEPGKLIVTNPTPYHITFDKLWGGPVSNDKNRLTANMVEPFSTLTISVPASAVVHQVHYNIINDFGGVSKIQNISL
ncbi:fimbrial biogenesis chaperone [Rahnella selenatireducens]|uniref:fimbrial biogenesis chaperone n=1 Tax=Rahnella selenatireducens TaxID=3389797 RepID=UPI003967FCA1